jgi:hypothetical protein
MLSFSGTSSPTAEPSVPARDVAVKDGVRMVYWVDIGCTLIGVHVYIYN